MLLVRKILVLVAYVAVVILTLKVVDFWIGNTDASRWDEDNSTAYVLLSEKYQYQTTPLVLRVGEELPPKSEKTKRILVVGDSFVYGNGYTNSNLTWWSTLYNNLLATGYDVEVVGAGHNGLSAYEELVMLQETDILQTVLPDLIIFGWVQSNDLESKDTDGICDNGHENIAAQVVCAPQNLMSDVNYAHIRDGIFGRDLRIFFDDFAPNIGLQLSKQIINKYQYDDDFNVRVGYGAESHYESTVTQESLAWNEKNFFEPFSEFVGSLNVPYFYVITDVLPPDGSDPHLAETLAYFDKYSINYYDFSAEAAVLPKLGSNSQYFINPTNSHPSHYTTSFYAQQVQRVLENNYEDILGQKDSYEPDININDATPWDIKLTKISDYKYSFAYPDAGDDANFLHMPIGQQFVKLSLQFPYNVKTVKLSGDGLTKAEVWLSSLGDKGWDDLTRVVPVGAQQQGFSWQLSEKNITSFNIHAEFAAGSERKLILELVP